MTTPANTSLSKHELKKFGLMFALVLALLFGIAIPLFRFGMEDLSIWPQWPWTVGMITVAWSIMVPSSLIFLYRPWMKFAVIAQWINTHVILLLLFYLVIFPIGLLLKLFGKDAMRRRFDEDATSYRVDPDKTSRDHVEKPY